MSYYMCLDAFKSLKVKSWLSFKMMRNPRIFFLFFNLVLLHNLLLLCHIFYPNKGFPTYLKVSMSPYRNSHFLASVLLIEEEHVYDVLNGVTRVPPYVPVQYLFEVYHSSTFFRHSDGRGIKYNLMSIEQLYISIWKLYKSYWPVPEKVKGMIYRHLIYSS